MKLKRNLFDLNQSLCCGQVFRWELQDDQWWYGIIRDHVIKIKQVEEHLEFDIFPEVSNPQQFISQYFRLDDDLEFIYKQIKKDPYIEEAIRETRGLRLIRQDPWECMISFIISQQNQIPKISRSIETLSHKYGTRYTFDGKEFYTFPSTEQLSAAKLNELKIGFDKGGCALGYRAKYVVSSALIIKNNALDLPLEDFREMPYETAHKLLQESFCGIGPKVADCILLFSLDKLEAFPLDTWIRKIISNLYFKSKKVNDKKIKEFCSEYFGYFAGYAQEYLYCNRQKLCQNF
ncbi:MAG: hypothetical protein HWN65_09820 [Candidatus Helarchaeota archaeon]|nr:hypothetical protein [Candidatus Helarchaeota archaeon]